MTSPCCSRGVLALLAAVWLLGCPPASAGQAPSWELEIHGGVAARQTATAGSQRLPAAGVPLVTSSPVFPSRETSSWFFGDGATLFNGANADFGQTARISPLDAAFGSISSGLSAAAGVRLRRRLNGRLTLEISLDAFPASRVRGPDVAAIVEAARASFPAAFLDLLSTGPFSNAMASATASTSGGSRRDIAVTAAAQRAYRPWGALTPYLTAGAGVLTGSGPLPSASVAGRYQFSILGEVPIAESDRVAFRFERGPALIGVVGGGLRRDLSGAWGLRVDARILMGQDRTRVLLDAQPSSTAGTPPGFIESFTNPAIQFSNDPSTGRRSSLSGPVLQSAEVFKGGFQARAIVSIGLTRRF